MKYIFILLMALFFLPAFTVAGTSDDKYPISSEYETSISSIDVKAYLETMMYDKKLALTSEQFEKMESILISYELEKEISHSSSALTINKVNTSLELEEQKDAELKKILNAGQYKMYKFIKLAEL